MNELYVIVILATLVVTIVIIILKEPTEKKYSLENKIITWCIHAVMLAVLIYISIGYGKGIIPHANKEGVFSIGKLELNDIYETVVQVDTGKEFIAVIKLQNNELRAYRFPKKVPKSFKVISDKKQKYEWEKFPSP